MIINSPCKGTVKDLKYLNDSVFSKYMMGVGFFVETKDKDIVSPVDGKISYIAETKHAILIENDDVNIMVHVGLDTCALKGSPFKIFVKEGETIKAGQKLMEVDHKKITKNNLNSDVIVVLVENNDTSLLDNLIDYADAKTVVISNQ
jgi:glucose-specific phosphotransferase system IIA component